VFTSPAVSRRELVSEKVYVAEVLIVVGMKVMDPVIVPAELKDKILNKIIPIIINFEIRL
jgi:hypothetical protein